MIKEYQIWLYIKKFKCGNYGAAIYGDKEEAECARRQDLEDDVEVLSDVYNRVLGFDSDENDWLSYVGPNFTQSPLG
jgi:hypothetical protein